MSTADEIRAVWTCRQRLWARGYRPIAEVQLPLLSIPDIPVMIGQDGRAWAGVPGKPLLDFYGRQKVDGTGKKLRPCISMAQQGNQRTIFRGRGRPCPPALSRGLR